MEIKKIGGFTAMKLNKKISPEGFTCLRGSYALVFKGKIVAAASGMHAGCSARVYVRGKNSTWAMTWACGDEYGSVLERFTDFVILEEDDEEKNYRLFYLDKDE